VSKPFLFVFVAKLAFLIVPWLGK